MASKLSKITHVPPMLVTFRHLFKKAFTVQYPEERREIPERSRGLHVYNIKKCMGCKACARVCPNNCIEIEVSTTEKGKKVIEKFDIYLGRCMFCGLCIDHCIGKGVLKTTPDYEFADTSRESLVYGIDQLVSEMPEEGEEEEPEEEPEEAESEEKPEAPKEEPAEKPEEPEEPEAEEEKPAEEVEQ